MDIDPQRIADRKLKEVFRSWENQLANDLSDIAWEKFCWTTKEGEKIFYADMSDRHLENCIKLNRRRGTPNRALDYEYARRKRQREISQKGKQLWTEDMQL